MYVKLPWALGWERARSQLSFCLQKLQRPEGETPHVEKEKPKQNETVTVSQNEAFLFSASAAVARFFLLSVFVRCDGGLDETDLDRSRIQGVSFCFTVWRWICSSAHKSWQQVEVVCQNPSVFSAQLPVSSVLLRLSAPSFWIEKPNLIVKNWRENRENMRWRGKKKNLGV